MQDHCEGMQWLNTLHIYNELGETQVFIGTLPIAILATYLQV